MSSLLFKQLKNKYHQRCQEKDNADEAFRNTKQSVTVTTKELQKIESKKDKCNESKEQADLVYKQSVDQLETARANWETEMEKACSAFQHLEEERINFLRDIFWKSTNVDSQTCVDQDDCSEHVRAVLESCDVQEDLNEFVERNKTGSTRPAPILYENYYGKKSVSGNIPDHSRTATVSTRPPQPPPPSQRPPPPRPTEPPLISFDDDPSGDGMYASVNNVKTNHGQQQQQRRRGGEYAALEPTNYSSGQVLKISRRYDAKEPGELTVIVGEQVVFVKLMKNNMIQVKKSDSKLHGLIPFICVTTSGNSTYL